MLQLDGFSAEAAGNGLHLQGRGLRGDLAVFELLKALNAVFGLGAPRACAPADPFQLPPVKRLVFPLRGFCVRLALRFIRKIIAVIAFAEIQLSAVNLRNPLADLVQKISVMRDHDNRAAVFQQLILQQLRGFVVDVVGRLIQQEHITRLHECGGDACAALFASGECGDIAVAVRKPELPQHGARLVFLCGFQIRRQMREHLFQNAAVRVKFRNLREI